MLCDRPGKAAFSVSVLWPSARMNRRERRTPPQDLEIVWGYGSYLTGAIWVIC